MELVNYWLKKISENQNDPLANYNLGVAYTKVYDFIKALEYYKKAVSIKPELYNAYINIGSIYSLQKDYNKAVKYYKKAIEYNKNDIQTLFRLLLKYKD